MAPAASTPPSPSLIRRYRSRRAHRNQDHQHGSDEEEAPGPESCVKPYAPRMQVGRANTVVSAAMRQWTCVRKAAIRVPFVNSAETPMIGTTAGAAHDRDEYEGHEQAGPVTRDPADGGGNKGGEADEAILKEAHVLQGAALRQI